MSLPYHEYVDDNEAQAAELSIIESLNDDGLFEDADFSGAGSIYKDPSRPPLGFFPIEVIDWSRINQLEVRGMNAPVTVASEVGDIKQGALNNAYFLSALALLSTNRDLLDALIVSDDNRCVPM